MMPARSILAKRGEDIAEDYFRGKRYKILGRNYRCALGEMDLVVQKGRTLVFVEVKTRRSQVCGAPEEAIHEAKKRKLFQIAQYYLQQHEVSGLDIQFDVLSIVVSPAGSGYETVHFEKALEF